MKAVKHGQSPISTLFHYQIDSPSEITIDLSMFNGSDEHIKKIKNSIIFAILLYYKENKEGALKKINIKTDHGKQHLLESKFLPLIHNQARFFDLTISPPPRKNQGYKLRDEWVKQIIKNINFPIEPLKNELSKLDISGSDRFLFYKTVSESPLQIRYKGYQIGKWNSIEKKITSVNNPDDNCFTDWAECLIDERSNNAGEKYFEKEEHYLESILLEKLLNNHLEISGHQITKLFPNSGVFFQFPVLLKPGASTKDKSNSAKYIDILAKSGDRPVVMELKVWNKQRRINSRGQYMFSAFSQVLSYCNYLVDVFGNEADDAKTELKELYSLNWKKPIIYIVINDIGDDDIANKFRNYITQIKAYIKNAELYFIEFEQETWDKHRIFIVKETRQYQKCN